MLPDITIGQVVIRITVAQHLSIITQIHIRIILIRCVRGVQAQELLPEAELVLENK